LIAGTVVYHCYWFPIIIKYGSRFNDCWKIAFDLNLIGQQNPPRTGWLPKFVRAAMAAAQARSIAVPNFAGGSLDELEKGRAVAQSVALDLGKWVAHSVLAQSSFRPRRRKMACPASTVASNGEHEKKAPAFRPGLTRRNQNSKNDAGVIRRV
jgi:hypothetical protein